MLKKKKLKRDFVSKKKALKKQSIKFIHKEQIRRNTDEKLKDPTQMGKLRQLCPGVEKGRALGRQPGGREEG